MSLLRRAALTSTPAPRQNAPKRDVESATGIVEAAKRAMERPSSENDLPEFDTPRQPMPNPLINQVVCMDALAFLKTLPDESVNCIVTSPPYFGLRDYGVDGQIGLEETPEAFVASLVGVFHEARRVLRSDGTFWLNLGDSYAQDKKWGGSTGGKHAKGLHGASGIGRYRHKTGLPGKNLIGIPWMVAFALQADGWILRSDIIWSKPNPMPESVTDRPTKAHEYVFLFAKSPDYWYDADAIKTPVKESSIKRQGRAVSDTHKNANGAPGQTPHSMFRARANASKQDAVGDRRYTGFNERYEGQETAMANARTVWTVNTVGFAGSHFATFPPKLIEPMILAGCPKDGLVLDPFFGAGTTGLVARSLGRNYIGSEINPDYIAIARERLRMPFEQHYITQESDFTDLPLFSGL